MKNAWYNNPSQIKEIIAFENVTLSYLVKYNLLYINFLYKNTCQKKKKLNLCFINFSQLKLLFEVQLLR